MGAHKGNEFYKKVKAPTGRPKKYTPKELWDKAVEYFAWVESNPLFTTKVLGNGRKIQIAIVRPMTEMAFCLFANISLDTFKRYKDSLGAYKDFCGVSRNISLIIYTQKFEGAAIGLFNTNIIARELGLSEKTQTTIKPKVGLDWENEINGIDKQYDPNVGEEEYV